jgi:NAD(P)H-dependent FMN reductase
VSVGGGHGGVKSHYHLRQIGVYIDLHFINKPEFFLNGFLPPAKFNSDGDLIDDEVKEKLKQILLSLNSPFNFKVKFKTIINNLNCLKYNKLSTLRKILA